MAIDKKYVDQILKVSEKAALASSYLVGKKDKIAADQAAVDAMRSELNKIDMNGEVVIGEGCGKVNLKISSSDPCDTANVT